MTPWKPRPAGRLSLKLQFDAFLSRRGDVNWTCLGLQRVLGFALLLFESILPGLRELSPFPIRHVACMLE